MKLSLKFLFPILIVALGTLQQSALCAGNSLTPEQQSNFDLISVGSKTSSWKDAYELSTSFALVFSEDKYGCYKYDCKCLDERILDKPTFRRFTGFGFIVAGIPLLYKALSRTLPYWGTYKGAGLFGAGLGLLGLGAYFILRKPLSFEDFRERTLAKVKAGYAKGCPAFTMRK